MDAYTLNVGLGQTTKLISFMPNQVYTFCFAIMFYVWKNTFYAFVLHTHKGKIYARNERTFKSSKIFGVQLRYSYVYRSFCEFYF